ncbi:hypothetical protein G6S93_004423 [Salmonella enterica]|nr:hypothetical protein [Salmonella enterica]
MQWLIVPAVLAVLWFFQITPAPGYFYVLLGCMYLFVALLERRIIEASSESRHRDNAILAKLEEIESHLDRQMDNVSSDLDDIKYTLRQISNKYM